MRKRNKKIIWALECLVAVGVVRRTFVIIALPACNGDGVTRVRKKRDTVIGSLGVRVFEIFPLYILPGGAPLLLILYLLVAH